MDSGLKEEQRILGIVDQQDGEDAHVGIGLVSPGQATMEVGPTDPCEHNQNGGEGQHCHAQKVERRSTCSPVDPPESVDDTPSEAAQKACSHFPAFVASMLTPSP